MDHIKFQLSHSHQAAVASLAMMLGITLGSIWIFDASDDATAAAAAAARSERAPEPFTKLWKIPNILQPKELSIFFFFVKLKS